MTMYSKVRTDILVFKTNLRQRKDLKRIAAGMSNEPRIKVWHVDVEDRDKVLRIESVDILPTDVIQLIKQAGYQCEELPDE